MPSKHPITFFVMANTFLFPRVIIPHDCCLFWLPEPESHRHQIIHVGTAMQNKDTVKTGRIHLTFSLQRKTHLFGFLSIASNGSMV